MGRAGHLKTGNEPMRSRTIAIAAALLLPAAPTFAGSHGAGYLASELMEPCRLADSDARETGTRAETECEQYIMGFVEALMISGEAGPGTEICTPEENTADEVRWAFIRWVYGDFSARKAMPAADAVLATLMDSFPCAN